MQLQLDYSRGASNPISQHAFKRVVKTRENVKTKIMELLNGERCTYDIAQLLGKELHKISGRFSELIHEGKIILVRHKIINGSVYGVYLKKIKHDGKED